MSEQAKARALRLLRRRLADTETTLGRHLAGRNPDPWRTAAMRADLDRLQHNLAAQQARPAKEFNEQQMQL